MFLDPGLLELKVVDLNVVAELILIVESLKSLAGILLLLVEDLSGTLALSTVGEVSSLQLHILDLTILLADLFKPLLSQLYIKY